MSGTASALGLILPGVTIVDVSHWNPETEPDWQVAAAHGCVGVIPKFVQGGRLDPMAVTHSWNAYAAGIGLLGGYDFGTAKDLGAAFLAQMGAEYGGDLSKRLLLLDAERGSPQMTVSDAEDFVNDTYKAEGRYPVLYMGRSGPDGTGKGLPSPMLSRCDLMLPAYGPHENELGKILPPGFRLPMGDTDRGGCLRLWQFTDGTVNGGPFPGLGKVDQSRAIGFSSLATLTAWWGS